MATQQILETRLLASTYHRVAMANLTIASGCESHLRDFVIVGVQELIARGFGSSEVKVALAEARLSHFVAEMIDRAASAGDSELHEPTFFAARNSLCPLWPFC